ncbi:hypothetical protein MLD38_034185 [Melastoma candidum]|uniref:Uncharacterized protein n=1 Tax=Melastoma candidum TaxID=119954 RepID=A0ACB9M993_9MYRT|nr:hypothetical protein MLD38_034185 [Melastoma candidum]
MTGKSLLRSGSYPSLLQSQNGPLPAAYVLGRKPSKLSLSGSREKERALQLICRFLGRRRVAMLMLAFLALFVFVFGSFTVNREGSIPDNPEPIESIKYLNGNSLDGAASARPHRGNYQRKDKFPSRHKTVARRGQQKDVPKRVQRKGHPPPPRRAHDHATADPHPLLTPSVYIRNHSTGHSCENFTFPPPPPASRRLVGPRPCPVCYLPVEEAIMRMPRTPATSPVLQNLTYIHDESPVRVEDHGGSDFGGYPSLKERTDSFNITESMRVHCGFVKGEKPGRQTGFDIDEAGLADLEKYYDVIVASAIFGNYDIIQQPRNISDAARRNIPFFMFIDEETEVFMKNSSVLDESRKVGLWKIVVVRNIPYTDARRNGKVPKLLLHRIFPNVRYSIWIDGKLQLVVDPYQILERFLWRGNFSFAISRHYRRFDVFEEAEANKAAGKYENSSIDFQIDFYRKEGLTPYTEAKLPITSDVPEGCVIIKEHIPITNLFTCMWFNEVDRFTSRDQLSFAMVRDKIMEKVDWNINMFLDCERRNFVIQAYHRDLLELTPPPPPPRRFPPPTQPAFTTSKAIIRAPAKKTYPSKRTRSDRKASSKRHRKASAGIQDNVLP